jgi:hypothetical protein
VLFAMFAELAQFQPGLDGLLILIGKIIDLFANRAL